MAPATLLGARFGPPGAEAKMTQQACHLPLDQWPAVNHTAWMAALRPPSLFNDDGGAAAGWVERMHDDAQRQYGYWLNYLQHQGLITENDFASRVTPALLNDCDRCFPAPRRMTASGTEAEAAH